jgi:DNA-binding HxlR family transcriptional regulator
MSGMQKKAPSRRGGRTLRRSLCPISGLLDIVGDKWTLLVIRDLFLNRRRYADFLASPERIPTNILADRLKRLEAAGLVKRELYQENPPRAEYFLTRKGADLLPVLRAMRAWGTLHFPDTPELPRLGTPEIRD